MDTNTRQTSATIYDFADFAAKLKVDRTRRAPAERAITFPPELPKATYGGAWYHEEAIQGLSEKPKH